MAARKRKPAPKSRNSLSLQRLEDRTVPSGNVAVVVSEGVLYVQGDNASNAIWVQVTGPGQVTVLPYDATTTVNGQAASSTFGGVTRGYYMEMAGGNDVVVIDGTQSGTSLFVDTGDGDDALALSHCFSDRGTVLFTGAGNDMVSIGGSDLRSTTYVATGDGNDTVQLGWTRFESLYIDGGAGVNSVGAPATVIDRDKTVIGFNVFPTLIPLAVADAATVPAGSSVSIDVAANDVANQGTLDLNSIVITAQPTQGTVTVDTAGMVVYTSTGTSPGTDSFQYTIKNSGGAVSSPGTVFVSIGTPSDTTKPSVSLSTTATSPSNAASFPFTATFSEAVTGFTAAGVSVTGGTVGSFTQVNGSTYTFSVTPTADGPVSVTVSAGAASDAAGNTNTASSAVTVTSDKTAPTVTANGLTTNTARPTLTGTVSDSTATVAVTVNGQTLTATVSGTTWSALVTTDLPEGTYTINVSATDPAGNVGTSSLANGLVVDLTAPTVLVSTHAPEPTDVTPIPFTIVFSEAVTGFSASGITVTNGTATNFVQVDAQNYTVDIVPTAPGAVTVSVPAHAAADAAGNGNIVSNTISRTFQTGAIGLTGNPLTTNNPAPTLTGTVDDPTATVTVTVNGQDTIATVTGNNWSATLTGPLAEGTYDIVINAQGTGTTTGSLTLTGGLVVDLTAPTAVVTATGANPTSVMPIPFQIVFSEPVNGFTLASLTVGNGTASNLQTTDGLTYTFDVAPAAEGDVTVTLAADAVTDPAGNGNEASNVATVTFTAPVITLTIDPLTTNLATPTLTGTVDDTAATVTVTVDGQVFAATVTGNTWSATVPTALVDGTYDITVDASDATTAGIGTQTLTGGLVVDLAAPTATLTATGANPTSVIPIPFQLVFSEPVNGFSLASLTVGNGTASNLQTTDGLTYTFDVAPTAQGDVTVSLAAGAVFDPAGNGNEASNVATVTFNVPVITLTIDSLTTNSATPTLTGTVDDTDATVTVTVDGQVFAATVTGNTWSATVPTALTDGTYDIKVDASDATTTGVGTLTLTGGLVVDLTAPTATLTTPVPEPTNAASFTVTVTFDEAVSGFDQNLVQVSNGTASNFTVVDDHTITFDVTPSADGVVDVTLEAGAVKDAAGNDSAVATLSRTSDRTAPTVAIDPTGTAQVTGTSSDATSGVAGVKVSLFDGTNYWDGTAFASATEMFFDATTTDNWATWSFAFTTPGTFTVHAQATDLAGNIGDATIPVTIL